MAVQQELRPGDPSSVAAGRRFVTHALTAPTVPTAVLDDAVLATSELVTNAIAAANDCIRVTVEVLGDCARVAVYDDGPGTPATCPRSDVRPHGRGLSIVEILSSCWGVRRDPPGKWVWAEFPVPVPLAS